MNNLIDEDDKDIIKLSECLEINDQKQVKLISRNHKSIDQPKNITLPLKKYQRAMIYHMFLKEQKSGFFILLLRPFSLF